MMEQNLRDCKNHDQLCSTCVNGGSTGITARDDTKARAIIQGSEVSRSLYGMQMQSRQQESSQNLALIVIAEGFRDVGAIDSL